MNVLTKKDIMNGLKSIKHTVTTFFFLVFYQVSGLTYAHLN